MMRAAFWLIVVYALTVFLASCEAFRSPQPVPPEKAQFVGTWRSSSGFILKIKPTGTASITQIPDSGSADAEALNINVAAPVINDMRVNFHGDTALLVITPLLYAREYRLNAPPHAEGDSMIMVLNGVTLVRR